MSHPVSCEKCGGSNLSDNGGADHHANHYAVHGIGHGIQHGSPIWLAAGVIFAAARLLKPKKFTCLDCGHVVKA